jgi:hypothetical protein
MKNTINRKGVILFNTLALITLLPTGMAIKQEWVAWLICLLLSGLSFFVFTEKYPQISLQKKAYFQTQLVGFVAGLTIAFSPEFKIACAFGYLIWIFFRYITLWDTKLFEYLSTKQ